MLAIPIRRAPAAVSSALSIAELVDFLRETIRCLRRRPLRREDAGPGEHSRFEPR